MVTLEVAEEEAVGGNLLSHTLCMFMEHDEELRARREALRQGVLVDEYQGLLPKSADQQREMVLDRHPGAFCRALVGDPLCASSLSLFGVNRGPSLFGLGRTCRVWPRLRGWRGISVGCRRQEWWSATPM